MLPKILIVCGGQRNGSTVLLEGLEATGSLLSCGEVFHPSGVRHGREAYELRLRPELNFFNFTGEAPRSCFSTTKEQRSRFDEYMAFLDAAARGRWIGLNIKNNSWHHFNHVWQDINRPPHAIRLFSASAATFVLVTRDVVAQALSEYRAVAIGVRHYGMEHLASGEMPKIAVDCQRLVARARLLHAQARTLDAWLSPSNLIRADYDTLFHEGRFSSVASEIFGGILSLKGGRFEFPLPRRRPSYVEYEWVANRSEVVEAFGQREFAKASRALQALAR